MYVEHFTWSTIPDQNPQYSVSAKFRGGQRMSQAAPFGEYPEGILWKSEIDRVNSK
jgi:hypothetical protein